MINLNITQKRVRSYVDNKIKNNKIGIKKVLLLFKLFTHLTDDYYLIEMKNL